ncbi:MAG TPA: septal ring lytic transglycosylase RlpA family protein [Beijerinckiaceae bacterium]|jgi:rare lipoprotein A
MLESPRTAVAAVLCAAVLAGCAQQPSAPGAQRRSSEYFPASKYGPASARVVQDGQPVPRGGGQYLVGRPYTIAGKRYVPREIQPGATVVGNASWYGDAFHGRRTANGEVYDMRSVSAAHPTMPLPSYARVTNLRNNRSIIVRVNDRGPYHGGRVLDVSRRVAEALDFRHIGTAKVQVDYIGRAGLAGSDDQILMATLSTDGSPAQLQGFTNGPRVMVAQATPPAIAPTPSVVAAAPAQTAIERAPPVVQQVALRQESPAPSAPQQMAALPAFAPSPPPRPFDLMTIPGADTPIQGHRRTSAASFFAPPSPVAATLERRAPFEGVSLEGLRELR